MKRNADQIPMEELEAESYHLFTHYNSLYFDGALEFCVLKWSSNKRMHESTGICNYVSPGACEMFLSESLLQSCSINDLKNSLLHQMIHAFLWVKYENKSCSDHCSNFQNMRNAINSSSVDDHQRPCSGYNVPLDNKLSSLSNCMFSKTYSRVQWMCDTCGLRTRKLRAPSDKDCVSKVGPAMSCSNPKCMWHDHKSKCAGTFTVAELQAYKAKKVNSDKVELQDYKAKNVNSDEVELQAYEAKKVNSDNAYKAKKVNSAEVEMQAYKTKKVNSEEVKLQAYKAENVNSDEVELQAYKAKNTNSDEVELQAYKAKNVNSDEVVASNGTQDHNAKKMNSEKTVASNAASAQDRTVKSNRGKTVLLFPFADTTEICKGPRIMHAKRREIYKTDLRPIPENAVYVDDDEEEEDGGIPPLINRRTELRKRMKLMRIAMKETYEKMRKEEENEDEDDEGNEVRGA